MASRGVGHDIVMVARRGGRLWKMARAEIGSFPGDSALLEYENRLELDRLTADVVPRLDVVVSPPHERSNWAMALGIPFCLVGPDIGPFAPLNRALLLGAGVAVELHSPEAAAELPAVLSELRDRGLLVRMADNGTGPPIDGFQRAARILAEGTL